MWSLWVSGGAKPRVYGGGKMAAYNNLEAGSQPFYLAQIDEVHAGKTMVDRAVRPGRCQRQRAPADPQPGRQRLQLRDVRLRRPTTVAPARRVTQIQTASGGSSFFNNSVLTIQIALPATYGSRGLTPPGETEAGLVEDRVHGRRRQRHHDLAGQHPRQPGPPGPALIQGLPPPSTRTPAARRGFDVPATRLRPVCGRFTQERPASELAEIFGAEPLADDPGRALQRGPDRRGDGRRPARRAARHHRLSLGPDPALGGRARRSARRCSTPGPRR